jgi:TonB family protein
MKPGFGGQITLFVTVAASGEVTDISVSSSTTDYPEFDNAVKDAVAAWKWKPVKKWRLEVLDPRNNGDYTGTVWLRFKEEMLK